LSRRRHRVGTLLARLVSDPPYREGDIVPVDVGFVSLTPMKMWGRVQTVLDDRVTVIVGGRAAIFVNGREAVLGKKDSV